MSVSSSSPSPLQYLRDIVTTKQEERQIVVGILVFDQVEVLDFCGPFEVLSVCRLGGDDDENVTKSPFSVRLVASTKEPITTIGGMNVIPHTSMEEVMASSSSSSSLLDILIVPGGMGTRTLRFDKPTLEFIRHQAPRVHILASVCTGSMLLAASGVLPSGTTITTHWKTVETLREWHPTLIVDKEHSVVKNENSTLYCSAGISAGIDMCFRLVTDLFGETVARETAKSMEYTYPEDYQRRIQF